MHDPAVSTPSHSGRFSEAGFPSCAVMVMSCDAYRDLWTPFFTLFRRFWPDCPFSVYLGSNHALFNDPGVTSLPAGDYSWSQVLRSGLQQIDSDYVLLLLEDYFLSRRVETATILDNLATLHTLGGIVLRLFPQPGPNSRVFGSANLGHLDTTASYRVSTQAAIWNRTELLTLLRDDESVWEFEWNGTVRARNISGGFYSTYRATLVYRQVVERGEWFRGAARYYGNQQIGCDFEARPVMGPASALKKALNRFRKNSISSVMRMRAIGRV